MEELGSAVQAAAVALDGIKFGFNVVTGGAKVSAKIMLGIIKFLWNVTKALYHQQYKKVGKINSKNLNERSSEIMVAAIKKEDLKKFEKMARKSGIVYSVCDRGDGAINIHYDILAAPRVQSIMELLYHNKNKKSQNQENKSFDGIEPGQYNMTMNEYLSNILEHVKSGEMTEEEFCQMMEQMSKSVNPNYDKDLKEWEEIEKEINTQQKTTKDIDSVKKEMAKAKREEMMNDKERVHVPFSKEMVMNEQDNKYKIELDSEKDLYAWIDTKDIVEINDTNLYMANVPKEDLVKITDINDKQLDNLTAKDMMEKYQSDIVARNLRYMEQGEVSEKIMNPNQNSKEISITINKQSLLLGEQEKEVKTRLPYSNTESIVIPKADIMEIDEGKTLFTKLDGDKLYDIYSIGENKVIGQKSGRELYTNHFDPVNRERVQKAKEKRFKKQTKRLSAAPAKTINTVDKGRKI